MAADIGRNAPCPCGSGKKYKNCCLGKETAGAGPKESLMDELRKALEEKNFGSLEEAKAFADRFMGQSNKAVSDDFHGLSPDQMHKLLYAPFESPELVSFPDSVQEPLAPLLSLFEMMAEAIGEEGLKATAKGNLPQKFCRAASEWYQKEVSLDEEAWRGSVNREGDFQELHVTRLVAEMAGLIRITKGRFVLRPSCRKLMAKSGLSGVYPVLLRTYMAKFNWSYRDGYPEITIIQQSSLFTLYLLAKYGREQRAESFYEESFLKAFPMVADEVAPREGREPAEIAGKAYLLRSFLRFAWFLGLVDMEELERTMFRTTYKIKARPQLERAVRFHGV